MTKYNVSRPKKTNQYRQEVDQCLPGVGNEERDFWDAGHVLKLDCGGQLTNIYCKFTKNITAFETGRFINTETIPR